MVIYGAIAEVSVEDLFIAGIIPGTILGLSLMITIYIMAASGLRNCPVRKRQSFKLIWVSFKRSFLSLLAPVVILGGILIGVVTPTEAGVIAVLYASLLGFIYKNLNWKTINDALKNTVKSTAVVMFILATSKAFAWLITIERVPEILSENLLEITANPNTALILISARIAPDRDD